MLDYRIELVSQPHELAALADRLSPDNALALDIETVNWWDRKAERVALVQVAFRERGGLLRAAVIDALSGLDLDPLRPSFEQSRAPKAIHNAAYDAVRLANHYQIQVAPIHDTMLAARRGGERRCSLKAQAETHLGLQLDKAEQRGDWSRRPLAEAQLRYAALDAVCTLMLYEDQIARGLSASYQLREPSESLQTLLPLDAPAAAPPAPDARERLAETDEGRAARADNLNAQGLALLGVVAQLPGRYSPERLAASSGSERVGIAGWIIDRVLGAGTDLDGDTIKLEVAELCERGLVRLSAEHRLEATAPGEKLWQQSKPPGL
ncbi:MAG TPA: hypothetical protein VGW12_00970 [Pyrinomonadaceae bacterium]|nr:hypothetical protein [Pyrinomonadaceae bacterium]